jgi:protein-S-isoprenylcysteine O-methyltransferase Ste14
MIFAYGTLCYVFFLGVFLYLIGFVGDFIVPRTIDGPGSYSFGEALPINVGLILLLAIQHTIMARPAFKKWWTQFIPAPIERATYVLITNLIFVLLFWQWRPVTDVVWSVEGAGATVLWTLFALGWGLVLLSTFLIDHFDLFGMRQVWLHARGQAYEPLPFQVNSLYRIVRHPLLLGWMIAFWSIPHMTVGHLTFAIVTTVYMIAAIQIEERDLVAHHGEKYADYRRTVSMLIPGLGGKG